MLLFIVFDGNYSTVFVVHRFVLLVEERLLQWLVLEGLVGLGIVDSQSVDYLGILELHLLHFLLFLVLAVLEHCSIHPVDGDVPFLFN